MQTHKSPAQHFGECATLTYVRTYANIHTEGLDQHEGSSFPWLFLLSFSSPTATCVPAGNRTAGRSGEPPQHTCICSSKCNAAPTIRSAGAKVERRRKDARDVGSTPTGYISTFGGQRKPPHTFSTWPISSVVEQLAHNRPVPGSIPRWATRYGAVPKRS